MHKSWVTGNGLAIGTMLLISTLIMGHRQKNRSTIDGPILRQYNNQYSQILKKRGKDPSIGVTTGISKSIGVTTGIGLGLGIGLRKSIGISRHGQRLAIDIELVAICRGKGMGISPCIGICRSIGISIGTNIGVSIHMCLWLRSCLHLLLWICLCIGCARLCLCLCI